MQQKAKEQYYTLEQAKRALGVSTDVLYNYVKNGALERVIPPGKKQGVYRRSQVEQLAKELHSFITLRRNQPTQFERVRTREEMRECLEINETLFGFGGDLLDYCMAVLEKNPETFFLLKDEGQIVGQTALWPLKPDTLYRVLRQIRPVTAPIEDIAPFEEGEYVDLYIVTIGIRPGFSKEEKRFYAFRVIAGLMDVIEDMGKRGISIGTIAARSNMPEGIRLMKGAGFTEITPLTPERRTFVIDVEQSGIPLLQTYKKNLTEWRQAQER